MPLLLLALDNTVLDRTAAFRAWAEQFLGEVLVDPDELYWVCGLDADGLTPREYVAEQLVARYGLAAQPDVLAADMRANTQLRLQLDPAVADALRLARDAGCTPVVVENGVGREIDEVIRRTGLDYLLTDWVIADEVGVSKPNPRIFITAATRLGLSLDDAWVIGASPELDIAAAVTLGVRSVWVSRGGWWSEWRYTPTRVAVDLPGAINSVLGIEPPREAGPAGPATDADG
ncbi:hypothetical protein GCM10010123_08880 [Pilimelia anulata]|uniref:Uncharacterized protein n=1 Tax=Pilimelia anulata TaxID=53371 RepID=A0A8J3B843_9ACTN|nr:HAD family hydrolase [Pilimelia anulata]GGJ81293.1 hypothetical protein GCM10010123_08880 [Pilimelia anulata]